MNIRPAISAPLPWLTFVLSKIGGKKGAPGAGRGRYSFFFPRSLKFTREGKIYSGITFLVGLAALNTGNNLLYLVLAMLLSLIIISGLMSESTLRGLNAVRPKNMRAQKGRPAELRIEVENKKTRLPSYSFTIEELPADGLVGGAGYCPKLKAASSEDLAVTCRFSRRGLVKLVGVVFKTRFPFGLFLKGRPELMEGEVLVYPAVRRITEREAAIAEGGHEAQSRVKGEGYELYGLSDYTLSDDSRRIHWKASARGGRLLKKEFERESEKRAVVTLANLDDSPERFEAAVDEAASLAAHYEGRGFSIALRTLSSETGFGRGQKHLDDIMTTLALVKPVKKSGAAVASARVL